MSFCDCRSCCTAYGTMVVQNSACDGRLRGVGQAKVSDLSDMVNTSRMGVSVTLAA